MPKISVVMPVYNGAAFLDEAIKSILGQTFADYEFIIINDGSTDNSGEVIDRYRDPRIKLINNMNNRGIIESLNRGIQASDGAFIARMDADDFSLPNRFSRQLSYMEAHPKTGVCGSHLQVMGSPEIWYQPVHPEEVKCRLLFHCCMAHPSVMLRREVLDDDKGEPPYNASYTHAEDYQLWSRLSHFTKLSNVPEVLLHYRKHKDQVSNCYQAAQLEQADRIRYEQLVRLGLQPTEREFAVHLDLCYYGKTTNMEEKVNWIRLLLASNMETRIYDQIAFMNLLAAYAPGSV